VGIFYEKVGPPMNTKELREIAGRATPVPGLEGIFITEDGHLVSQRRKTPRLLKWRLNRKGYPCIGVWSGTYAATYTQHRLLMLVFRHSPGCESLEVDHINGLKTDNRLENLRWATSKQNKENSVRLGLNATGTRHGRSKLTESDVMFIREAYIPEHKTFGARALARRYEMDRTVINDVVHGRSWKNVSPRKAKRA
jgi:hypothetical protein